MYVERWQRRRGGGGGGVERHTPRFWRNFFHKKHTLRLEVSPITLFCLSAHKPTLSNTQYKHTQLHHTLHVATSTMDHLVGRLRSLSIDLAKPKEDKKLASSHPKPHHPAHPSSQQQEKGGRSASPPANTLPLPQQHVPARTTLTNTTLSAINNKLPILLPPPTLFAPGQASDILNRTDLEEVSEC